MGLCDQVRYFEHPCPKRPTEGVRQCEDYKLVPFGSQRTRGPRPGHSHKTADLPVEGIEEVLGDEQALCPH